MTHSHCLNNSHVFLIIALLSLITACKKDLQIQNSEPATYLYSATGNIIGRDVEETPNGFVICGYGSAGSTDSDIILLFANSTGEETSRKVIGTSGNDETWAFAKDRDGGYVVAGWTDVNSPGTNDILLIKTDANGNALWTKTFGTPYNDIATDVAISSEGFLITGIAGSSTDDNIWILKTDFNGDSLWSIVYGGNQSDGAMSICIAPDNAIGVTGFTNSTGNGSTDGFLMKINESGSILQYNPFGTQGYEEPHDITFYAGNWLITGHAGTTDIHTHDIFLQTISPNGSPIEFKTFGEHDHDGGEAMCVSRNMINITGRSTSRSNTQDAILFRMDGMLNGKTYQWFETENESAGYAIAEVNGSLLICGYRLDPITGNKAIMVVKTP